MLVQVDKNDPFEAYKILKKAFKRTEVRDYVKLIEDYEKINLADNETPQTMILKRFKLNK